MPNFPSPPSRGRGRGPLRSNGRVRWECSGVSGIPHLTQPLRPQGWRGDGKMDWRDTGFVLTARRHGENALIVELLTEAHGRHAGLVRGGQSPKRRALLQPGNLVAVHWRGRLPEHLGAFEIELLRPHAAGLIDDPDRLAALSAAAALTALALPEQEPHRDIFQGFAELVASLDSAAW